MSVSDAIRRAAEPALPSRSPHRGIAMRAVYLSIAGALLFAAWGGPPVRADGAPDTSDDVRTLTIAGLRTDGPALLEFFRERARLDADADRLAALTQQLGDPAAEVRAHAAAQLVRRGTPAIPALRHAVNNFIDSVVSDRARRCLQAIER